MMLVGDLCTLLYKDIAGIRPDPVQPGFVHVIMRPTPAGDLNAASATHRTALGTISSEWTTKGDVFNWTVTIPPNTTASLFIPGKSAEAITESREAAAKAEGLTLIAMRKGAAEFAAKSGTYHLESH